MTSDAFDALSGALFPDADAALRAMAGVTLTSDATGTVRALVEAAVEAADYGLLPWHEYEAKWGPATATTEERVSTRLRDALAAFKIVEAQR